MLRTHLTKREKKKREKKEKRKPFYLAEKGKKTKGNGISAEG